MLKNPLMESLRKGLSTEEQAQIDDSFALADRISYLLKKHQITQRQLAERLGKRESEVSKWLSGRHNFTQSTLTKISCAIGESIYTVPKADHQMVIATEMMERLNVLRATIYRNIKESRSLNHMTFQSCPQSLSKIEITNEGIIHNGNTEGFASVQINPEKFKNIEKETAG